MRSDNVDVLLVKLESITNLLTLLEESFAMSQNTQSESVMKVLKVLTEDVEQMVIKLMEENCT